MAATWTYHKIDGFDHQAAADVPKGYFSGSAGAQVSTADTAFNRGYGTKGVTLTVSPGNHSTWRVGCRIKRGNTDVENFLQFVEGGAHQVIIRFRADGYIEAYRGPGLGTLLGTSSAAVFPANQWLWVCVLVSISDAAGVVKVFVSDTDTPVAGLDLASQDTQNTGNSYASSFTYNGGSSTVLLDDLHISAGSGTPVDGDCLADSTVYTDFALTPGTYSDFTPSSGTDHIALLRDAPATFADGDSTYVYDTVVDDRESVLYDDLPVDVTDINMVQVTAMIRKNDAAARTVKLGTRRSGNNTDETNAQNVSDTYQFLDFVQVVDPETSAAWTRTNVNSTEGMVRIIS